MDVGLVATALVALALGPFIEPSDDAAELMLGLVFVCVAPAAVHDPCM
jgi:hypothetical protein